MLWECVIILSVCELNRQQVSLAEGKIDFKEQRTSNLKMYNTEIPWTQAVLIGTDFSGIGSFEQAAHKVLDRLGYKGVNMFCCETNRQCQRILLQYQCPHKLYANITYRNASSAPHVQWYGAGFPCQPFSNAGLQLGVKDHLNRGLLVAHCVDYIQCKKPVVNFIRFEQH